MIKKLLVACAFVFLATSVSAGSENSSTEGEGLFKFEYVSDLYAQPYENIKNKWQVDFSYKDGNGSFEETFYVYNVSGETDMFEKITNEFSSRWAIVASTTEIKDALNYKTDKNFEFNNLKSKVKSLEFTLIEYGDNNINDYEIDLVFTKEYGETVNEGGMIFNIKTSPKYMEKTIADRLVKEFNHNVLWSDVTDLIINQKSIKDIEAKRYSQVKGKWQVAVEYERGDSHVFYVYNIDNENDLVIAISNEIKKKRNMNVSWEDVRKQLDYDRNEFESVKPEAVKAETKMTTTSAKDQEELIKALVQVIILILMQNSDTDVDLSSLLKFL